MLDYIILILTMILFGNFINIIVCGGEVTPK